MEKRFWNEIDEQETLKKLKIKIETEKLKEVNKIEGLEIEIESIKNTKKEKQKS